MEGGLGFSRVVSRPLKQELASQAVQFGFYTTFLRFVNESEGVPQGRQPVLRLVRLAIQVGKPYEPLGTAESGLSHLMYPGHVFLSLAMFHP